jgi:hypothetical protein
LGTVLNDFSLCAHVGTGLSPESPPFAAQGLTFIKNDKGEVMAIIHQMAGLPDSEGKKLKSE